MHNVDTIPKLSFSLPNHHASDVSESNAAAFDTYSSTPRPIDCTNSLYFHELMKIVDNELKKTVQTSTPGPPTAINSSKENNASQDVCVIERMAPLLPKSPSRSQSTLGKLIFNFYLLVSRKNQWQIDPEQEMEIMLACSMIKKRVLGPRGKELMAALRRLGSHRSSLNAKRRIYIFLLRETSIFCLSYSENFHGCLICVMQS
ncbi:hypothetical protein CQW23_18564 [Capsicum baccatum]|uniref:Uncharacterized protein n=1 Tax=Capsicum baccatum TaxID=33114 RepID=A0A2G2W3A8_CAPBA|nr:hypothetical protein CQW23_18564 [Capsicum baccatum]